MFRRGVKIQDELLATDPASASTDAWLANSEFNWEEALANLAQTIEGGRYYQSGFELAPQHLKGGHRSFAACTPPAPAAAWGRAPTSSTRLNGHLPATASDWLTADCADLVKDCRVPEKAVRFA